MVMNSFAAIFVTLYVLLVVLHVSADPTTNTECGPVTGNSYNTGSSTGYSFLGIPYATPPTGSLRWQPTVSLQDGNSCWKGTYAAQTFGSSCVQPDATGNEDCLFLNVWTPTLPQDNTDLLPVLFYIHGGGFNSGSGEMNLTALISETRNIVVVTINYRLNGFGFLALDELSQNDRLKRSVSGNYGIIDMITALQWTIDNIANFGGDPSSITISGQSSGGTGVLALILSPLASGMFQRAFLMSASTRIDTDLAAANTQNRVVVSNSGCESASNVLDCLYKLSSKDVVSALPWNTFPFWGHASDFDLPTPGNGDNAMLCIVDGVVIPQTAAELFASGKVTDVPTIIGTCAQETDLAPTVHLTNYSIPDYEQYIAKRLSGFPNTSSTFAQTALKLYDVVGRFNSLPQLAYETMTSDIRATCGQNYIAKMAASAFKSPVYRYVVTQVPSVPMCNGDWCAKYSFHTYDLSSLADGNWWIKNPTPADTQFTKMLQTTLVSLMYDGVVSSSPEWTPFYNSTTGRYTTALLNTPNLTIASEYAFGECAFWDENEFNFYAWNS